MTQLEKRTIERTGQEVTFIGFGALEIGRDWGIGSEEEWRRPDEQEAGEVLQAVLDRGINLIDTASAYHRSEERIGRYLSERRDEFVLASKCGEHSREPDTYYDFSYRAVKESIDRSLKLLHTDVIDIMQIHFGPNPHDVLDEGETLAAMKEAQKEGKVRCLGASADGDVARRCIESGEFDVVQLEYNLLQQREAENIKRAHEKGMGVFIRGGLKKGILTKKVFSLLDKDFPEKDRVKRLLDLCEGDADLLTALAWRFLQRHEGISSVLLGTKRVRRIDETLAYLSRDIDESLVEKAAAIGRGV